MLARKEAILLSMLFITVILTLPSGTIHLSQTTSGQLPESPASSLIPNVYGSDGTAATVGTSTSTSTIPKSAQRNSFYANGRVWVFYYNGSSLDYSSSTDGSTWSSATFIATQGTGGNDFSFAYNGTDVFYLRDDGAAYPSGATIHYRQGVPASNGVITWLAAEATICTGNGVSGQYCYHPTITVTSSGNAWIEFEYYDSSTYTTSVIVRENGHLDGTWSQAYSSIRNTVTNSNVQYYGTGITALSNSRILAMWWDTSSATTIGFQMYNGATWAALLASTSNQPTTSNPSITGAGGIANIAYETSSNNLVDIKYFAGNNTKTETTIQSSVTTSSAPSVSADTTNGNLYVFWGGSPSSGHVYYKRYVNSTNTWDTDPTDWLTESLTTNLAVSTFPLISNSKVGIVDEIGTSNPWSVRFSSFLTSQADLNVKVDASDSSTVLTGATVTMYNGTKNGPTAVNSTGWVTFKTVGSAASVIVAVNYEGTKVYGNYTQPISGAVETVQVNASVYVNNVLHFAQSDNTTLFTPTQVQIQAPNGTLLTLTSYTINRMQNGTWTYKQVQYWNNDVIANPNPTYAPSANSQTRQIQCKIYPVTVNWADNSGTNLIQTSTLTYSGAAPNSTVFGPLNAGTAQRIQNGTTSITASTWQSIVVTKGTQTFDSSVTQSPTIQTYLYLSGNSNEFQFGLDGGTTSFTWNPSTLVLNVSLTHTAGTATFKLYIASRGIPSSVKLNGANQTSTFSGNILTITSLSFPTANYLTLSWNVPPTIQYQVLMFDGSTPISGATVTLNNGTITNKTTNSTGWVKYTGQSSGSPTINVTYEGTKVYGPYQIGSSTIVNQAVNEYSGTILSFFRGDTTTPFTPTQVALTAPNGTALTLSSYTINRMQNGTWTVTQVLFWGNDVVPATTTTFTVTANSQTKSFTCRIYLITPAWHDASGNALTDPLASFKWTPPNSTLSGVLTVGQAYWVQNSTTTISAVMWNTNVDVAPSGKTFDGSSGSPVFNVNVYKSGTSSEFELRWTKERSVVSHGPVQPIS